MRSVNFNIVIGTRPNIVKAAALVYAIRQHNEYNVSSHLSYRLIHTGQHYDVLLSGSLLKDLDLGAPDINLQAHKTRRESRLGRMVADLTSVFKQCPAHKVVVFGDVDSTLAASIAAKETGQYLVHIESGLRSGNLSMPEERNRKLSDSLSDLLLTSLPSAQQNLINEGYPTESIKFVGNLMIDTLMHSLSKCKPPQGLEVKEGEYLVLTIHRQSNTKNPEVILQLLSAILSSAGDITIIFPAHPRTRKLISQLNMTHKNLLIIEPLPYLEFGYLMQHCRGVITDSGGVSEEATVYNKPCISLRRETERGETITMGTNMLSDGSSQHLEELIHNIATNKWKQSQSIPGWDGRAGVRALESIS